MTTFWNSVCRNESCLRCSGARVYALPLGVLPSEAEDEANCYCGDPADACEVCAELHDIGEYPE